MGGIWVKSMIQVAAELMKFSGCIEIQVVLTRKGVSSIHNITPFLVPPQPHPAFACWSTLHLFCTHRAIDLFQ